ncbi:MAG: zf-HC2 domain-containing protein [Chloroflexi bacterium]|nr:zf-HC2 domain-containing protein [Chloroflexota bacterium]
MSFDDAVEQAMREQCSSASATGVAEVTHADVRDRLSEHLDGDLTASNQERIKAHLDLCPSCRAFLRTLQATRDLTARIPASPLPDAARKRLLEIPEV